MSIKDFYQNLGGQLEIFKGQISEVDMSPIRDRLAQVCAECSAEKTTKEAAIDALFELSSYFHQRAAELNLPVFSETFDSLITKKIEVLSSGILPSSPRTPFEAIEGEIKETEQQLAQTRKSMDNLLSMQSGDSAVPDFILAVANCLDDLEKKLERLMRQKAALCASRKMEAPVPLGCAGLRNRSNKCYAHGCLKGLWASKKFREIIERKALAIEESQKHPKDEAPPRPLTALYLHHLFLTFDATTPSEIIEPEEKAIGDVIREMAKYHPGIMDGQEKDSAEFLNWLFDDILDPQEHLFSYVEEKRRPRELAVDFWIPNIDCKETTDGNLFIIQLPNQEQAHVRPQAAFDPSIVEEVIDPEAILSSEKNKEKDAEAIFAKLSVMPRSVHVRKTRLFHGESPPCLFVHLWRQIHQVDVPLERLKEDLGAPLISELHLTDEEVLKLWGRKENVKVPVKVEISARLFINHVDGHQIPYTLKGVVVHTGRADAGHYYAYLPVDAPLSAPAPRQGGETPLGEGAPGEHGDTEAALFMGKDREMPSAPLPLKPEGVQEKGPVHAQSVVLHNDQRVVRLPYGPDVERETQEQGYILIYDRED